RHTAGEAFGTVFLPRQGQRGGGVGLVKCVVERVDWCAVAAQYGLTPPVEIDDDRRHRIVFLGAIRDRLADQLISESRREFLNGQQALRTRARRAQTDASQYGD